MDIIRFANSLLNRTFMSAASPAIACRVLLVDDDKRLLTTLERLLTTEGYSVTTASTPKDALRLFSTQRFHVAVVDLCLDSTNSDNRDGLVLINNFRTVDPTTALIVLSQHADQKLVRQLMRLQTTTLHVFEMGRSLVYDYLAKSPEDLRILPESVGQAFTEIVQMNCELRIEDEEQVLPRLSPRMRLVRNPRPKDEDLRDEMEELLRKLFGGWDAISVRMLSRISGYSRAFVFQVTPHRNDGPGMPRIVKIGEYPLIEQEIHAYSKYVDGRSSRSPTAITPRFRTRTLGGLVYTFAGLGNDIRDFAEFYLSTVNAAAIEKVIRHLFTDTLALQHGATGTTLPNVDLRQIYTRTLRLKQKELETEQRKLLETETNKKLLLTPSPVGLPRFWVNDSKPFPMLMPYEFAGQHNFTMDSYNSIIHGDLNAHNVLIDSQHQNETWLIDFANTIHGPLVQDYVTLETSISIELVESRDLNQLFDWIRALYSAEDIANPALPDEFVTVPEIAKAHRCIVAVRQMAFRDRGAGFRLNEKAYLIGMYFTMLRLMTVHFLPPSRRRQALYSASFIATRLQRYL